MVYDLANHVAYVYTNKQESKLKVLILAADIPIQESIEFPGNSPGKSQVLGCKLTSAASVVWLYCDITAELKQRA